MFLTSLTGKQREGFLSIAMKLIQADGVVDQGEEAMLGLMKQEMGLPASALVPDLPIQEAAACFQDRKVKTAVMLELIGLGHADHDYNAAESQLIGEVAEVLGFTREEIHAFENWVLRQLALMREATEFMNETEEVR